MKYGNRNRTNQKGPLRLGRNGTRSINQVLPGSPGVTELVAPVNAAAASRVLTVTNNFANGETVTVGGLVYTFQTVLTNVARNVHIKATAALSLDALKAAVNNTGGVSGTDYAAATVAHPTVEATTNTDTTQLFVARVKGVAGNAFTSTETCANASFPGATFTGGVDGTPGAADETRYYGGYFYYSPTESTISTSTWVRSAQYTTF